MLDRRQAACCAERVLLYQASTRSSLMGKSCTFAVAREAEIPTAAAAMRQSAWCRVVPAAAKSRRQVPARRPSGTPSGANRRPRNSRTAWVSSSGWSPRQISSTEMAHTHGCVPRRRNPATRSAAGRPRRASMSTVESSSSRATIRCAGCRLHVVGAPRWPGRRPRRAPKRVVSRGPIPHRPNVVRLRGPAAPLLRCTRFVGGFRRVGRALRRVRRPTLCANACAEVSPRGIASRPSRPSS